MRRTACLVAVLLIAACNSPASRHSPGAALDARQVAVQLRLAQTAMFANRYSAADGLYQGLLRAAPRSAAVHAEHALFLNYRNQFAAARAEAAQAVALDARDGHAAAILCRVDDWSQLLAPALRAGRAAVRLAPADALAHLFLGEVLADTGDTAAAQQQIDSAGGLIDHSPTAYLRAERERELANLAGDRGARKEQITALQAARDAQPLWLYHSVELVDADVAAGDSAAAGQVLDAAAQQSPDDAETLRTLGEDAFFAGDASAAAAIWAKAAALAPDDPDVLDMAGAAQVAAKHDINAAISDFAAALSLRREDPAAAAYMLAIARYIQHSDALGRREIADAVQLDVPEGRDRAAPAPPDPDIAAAADATVALTAVNAARAAAGLSPVRLDSRLSTSARSHTYYWLFNNFAPSVTGLGIHQETPGLAGFSGVLPWNRATAHGYPNQRVGEDITHRGAPGAAVADWVNSVYHRFAMMRPDLTVIGYGSGEVGSLLMEDMEFGFAVARSAAPAVYPGAGQTNVPATFVDNELPDPVPTGAPRTTGYPVTVTFSTADAVRVLAFTLAGPDGRTLNAYSLAPSAETENSASLLPTAPLRAGTAYTAHIVASINGTRLDRTWSFTTAS